MEHNHNSSKQIEYFTAFCEEEENFYNLSMYISDFYELTISCVKLTGEGKSKEYIFQENFQNLLTNKFYLPYESIEEIKQYISCLILNNSKKKTNNLISIKRDSLFLEIPAPLGKANALFFELKQNFNYIIENLNKELNQLSSEFTNMRKEMDDMKKDYETRIKFLENENKNKSIEIKNLKEKLNKEEVISDLSNSDIILLDEREEIIKMINPEADLKSYSFKLIFKASVDGNLPNAFHNQCDHKGPTIIFIKINNGKRIGGYTSVSWSSNNEFKSDEKAFLFSLDKREKYELNSNLMNYAVAHYQKYGPTFGSGYGLYISNNYKSDENCSQENNCYKNKNIDFVGIDKSKAYFSIFDYEVFTCTSNI